MQDVNFLVYDTNTDLVMGALYNTTEAIHFSNFEILDEHFTKLVNNYCDNPPNTEQNFDIEPEQLLTALEPDKELIVTATRPDTDEQIVMRLVSLEVY